MKNITMKSSVHSCVVKIKTFYFRLPAKVRIVSGLAIGGLVGLLGGPVGFFIGIVLGYLVQQLLGQFRNDHEIHVYFKNPGAVRFYECEPGLAAFCGLGMMVALQSVRSSSPENAEALIKETARAAGVCFPAADSALTEQFCRIAWLERENLNPDLLLESLKARLKARLKNADVNPALLGSSLSDLASAKKARAFADGLRAKIDPGYKPEPTQTSSGAMDPWKILGISPETPACEIRNHYRRLAAQFHPDALQGLDDEHLETASRAFIAIREAYDEIMSDAPDSRAD